MILGSRPQSIGFDQTISKSDNFIESNVDQETILMHLDEGNFSSLESTGLRIWQLLDRPTTAAQICETLLDEFEVDASTCQEQTIEFLDQLHDRGLIETVGN